MFGVVRGINKGEVKVTAELLFKAEVESVQILNQRGEQKRFGRFMGRRDHAKKAHVSPKLGQEISLGVEAK